MRYIAITERTRDSRQAAVEESSRTCCNVGSRSAAAKESSRTCCNIESE